MPHFVLCHWPFSKMQIAVVLSEYPVVTSAMIHSGIRLTSLCFQSISTKVDFVLKQASLLCENLM